MNEEELRLERLRLRSNAFSYVNGMYLESLELDHAVYRLDIRPESLNPYGMVHGGALYTLADDAAGSAAHSDGEYYVTQSGDLHFLRNRGRGVIRAEARVRHRGRTTVLIDVSVIDEEGTLMATGLFTYFRVDKALMDKKAAETHG